MLTLIDNYDSFTYNLVHFLGELGAPARVYRNDKVTVHEVLAQAPDVEDEQFKVPPVLGEAP